MKSRPVYCESCWDEPADIYAEGEWLCSGCEAELDQDCIPDLSALEIASILWACDTRIVK